MHSSPSNRRWARVVVGFENAGAGPPGKYPVDWQEVKTIDAHKTITGTFQFTFFPHKI
jgi:hypothetical protein